MRINYTSNPLTNSSDSATASLALGKVDKPFKKSKKLISKIQQLQTANKLFTFILEFPESKIKFDGDMLNLLAALSKDVAKRLQSVNRQIEIHKND